LQISKANSEKVRKSDKKASKNFSRQIDTRNYQKSAPKFQKKYSKNPAKILKNFIVQNLEKMA